MSDNPSNRCEFEFLRDPNGDCTPVADWASYISSMFVLTTTAISFIHIRNHLKFSRQRMLTKYTIRILLMPPIYGVECWLALRFPAHAVPYRLLREGYEAFVIFSFMQFLLAYLGGAVYLARRLHMKRKINHKDQHHMFPFNFLEPWRSGAQFVRLTLVGTLQYVPASLLVMVLSLSAWQLDWYHDGVWKFNDAYMYCALITNCSQVWAMYCLVLFYHALHDELKPIKPFGKFLSVKLVVFFTYWQSLGIGIMQTMEADGGVLDKMEDAITGEEESFDDQFDPPGFTQSAIAQINSREQARTRANDSEEFGTAVQNFIICVEMFFFAIGHIFAFPAEEFEGRIFHEPVGDKRIRGGSIDYSDENESEEEEQHRHSDISNISIQQHTVDDMVLLGTGGGGGDDIEMVGLIRVQSNPESMSLNDVGETVKESRMSQIRSKVLAGVGKRVDQVRESSSLVGDSISELPRGLAATILDSGRKVAISTANLPESVRNAARDGGVRIDEARGAAEVALAVGDASVKVARSIGTGVVDIARNVGQFPVRTVGSAVGGTVNVGKVAATQVLRRLPMLPPLHKEKFRDGINFTDILNAIRTVTYLEVEEERSHLLDFFEEQDSAWSFSQDDHDDSDSDLADNFSSHIGGGASRTRRNNKITNAVNANINKKHGSTKMS